MQDQAGVPLTPEEERAAIVAYTGLWQLRELAPEAEAPELGAARIALRERLDANDAAAGGARPPAHPTADQERSEVHR